MHIRLPFEYSESLQQTALIVNTVILILALIVAELIYSESPAERRVHLRFFLPLLIILIGILMFAVLKQVAKS